MMEWKTTGSVPPKELTEARVRLHWAAQLLGAAGASLVPPQPDDSHTAMEYLPERSGLVGGATRGEGRRVALSLPDLRVVVLDPALEVTHSFPLEGKTLNDGLDWLGSVFETKLTRPDYDMPPHAIADGAPFTYDRPEAFEELALWFGNAARVLESLDAGAVSCWPHHFDIAVLRSLGGDETIGIGLSPGDGSYDEPYWYVSPWPYPPKGAPRPPLEHGHWHEEGFVAAILTGTELTTAGDGEAQARRVEAFLDSAVRGAEELVASA